MSHDVVGVALRTDVSRHEDTPTQRRDTLPVELPRYHPLKCSHHRIRRCYLSVIAKSGDSDRAPVVAQGMTCDHVVAADASLVDSALLVNEVVVTDISPAPGDRVVVVDRPHRCSWVWIVVFRDRVMNDRLGHLQVLALPDLLARGVEAQLLIRSPVCAGDHCGLRHAECLVRTRTARLSLLSGRPRCGVDVSQRDVGDPRPPSARGLRRDDTVLSVSRHVAHN